MIKNNNNIKKFITDYNIGAPDWNQVPIGFPYCDFSSLTYQEKIIWDAAVLAWINEHPTDYIGQKIAGGTLASIGLLFASSILLSFLYYADVNYNLGMKFLTDIFA